jgi:predicted DNA-binding transcriptional regulator AlpA
MRSIESTTANVVAGTDQLTSIPDACAILSIGHTKCWELIGEGALDVVRLGARCTRIKKSSIDRLVQHGVSKQGAPR